MVRGKMGWHRDVASPAVPMPEPEVRIGDVVSFRVEEDDGGVPDVEGSRVKDLVAYIANHVLHRLGKHSDDIRMWESGRS